MKKNNTFISSLAFAFLFICLCLSGCGDKNVLTKADTLFENGQYEEALDKYKTIEADSDEYNNVCTTIYEKGKQLYDIGEYEMCIAYMESLDEPIEFSYYYEQLATARIKMNLGEEPSADYLKSISIFKKWSEEGCEAAGEILNEKPYADYLPLLEYAGLYKSEKTFTLKNPLMQYDKYCYISLSDCLLSTSFMTETITEITEEKVKNNAGDNNYRCEIKWLDDNRYLCEARYKDKFNKEKYELNFELKLVNEGIEIELLSSTETQDVVSFVDGLFYKV